jgi:hypothetical protein
MTLRRAGRMHHHVIGTTHSRKRVLAFADEHTITVIELDTGESPLNPHHRSRQDLLAQQTTRARPLAELPNMRPMSRDT